MIINKITIWNYRETSFKLNMWKTTKGHISLHVEWNTINFQANLSYRKWISWSTKCYNTYNLRETTISDINLVWNTIIRDSKIAIYFMKHQFFALFNFCENSERNDIIILYFYIYKIYLWKSCSEFAKVIFMFQLCYIYHGCLIWKYIIILKNAPALNMI